MKQYAHEENEKNMKEEYLPALEIRELDVSQIEEVYETYMRADFPKNELRPLQVIINMRAKGAYDCLGLFDGGNLTAYAYMVKGMAEDYVLLDYLAVCGPYRDRGIGSRLLVMLREWYREKKGIFLECECLRTSADEMQKNMRRRRQDFYLKNGCASTSVKALVYGVEYDIFYIPLKKQQTEYAAQLDGLYRELFSGQVRKKYVKIWTRSRNMRYVYRWSRERRQYEECCSLTAALGIRPDAPERVISLVGAGGKTTTMYQLADELAEMGKRVLVTTTTHIARPLRGQILEVEHVRQVAEDAWKTMILTVGRLDRQENPCAVKKLAAPEGLDDEKELDRLLTVCDVVLIEADGAAGHPVKVPRQGEPVILPQTEMMIACVGLSGAGQPWKDGCFRFVRDGGWLRKQPEETIDPEDLAWILSDGRGMKKDLPRGGCKYRIVMNQVDDREKFKTAAAVALALPEQLQDGCIVSSYDPKER